MKKRLDLAWFNFARLFQWHRVLGIGSLCLIAYVLVFFVFGRTDVSGFLPRPARTGFHWPDLPHFSIVRTPDKVTVYTVPSRQFTRAELAQLPQTNQPPVSPR